MVSDVIYWRSNAEEKEQQIKCDEENSFFLCDKNG